MMPLYKLSTEFQAAINDAYLSDEVTLQQVDILNSLTCDIEEKAINIAMLIKNLEAESSAVRQAADAMHERAHKLDDKIDNLKNYLKHNLEACKILEVSKSPYFKIKIKKNNPAVLVENDDLVPDAYKKTKITISTDKVLLAKVLKEGVEVPGVKLTQSTRLEIK